MIDLFSNLAAIHRSLDYHLKRHSVLASNVANAETPGYRPKDVSFDAYLTRAQDVACTDPRHLGGSEDASFSSAIFEDTTVAAGNDGNAVSTEREMAKISANSIRYKAMVELINRRLSKLKYAASDGTHR